MKTKVIPGLPSRDNAPHSVAGASDKTTRCHDLAPVNFEDTAGIVPCFTPGAEIATVSGTVAVENLRAGDKLLTRDNGIRPIAWIGRRALTAKELADEPDLRPVRIRAGALGRGLPLRDLIVSPSHRVLVSGRILQETTGESEMLISARHLDGMPGIERVTVETVEYLHILFERHEVILSDGAWTESFQPMPETLSAFCAEQREEVLKLFPELRTWGGLRAFHEARHSLSGAAVETFRARQSGLAH